MASRLTWMRDWLISPSLGHYLQIQPGEKTNGSNKNIQSTKLLLKKHMVDTFFEQALHQIDPDAVPVDAEDEVSSYEVSVVEETPTETAVAVIEPRIGYYVFAIALQDVELELPETGIDPDQPLFLFPFGKTQAIVSEVSLDIYGEDVLQARLNDSVWFEQTLKIHNVILGQIQSQSPMVPMRVCTICDSTDALKAFLDEHHDDFLSTLELIEGMEVWSLSIICNQRKLRVLTEKASNRVRAIYGEMAGKSDTEAEGLNQKLESILEEEARTVCKACVKHSHGTLNVLSSEALIQPLDPVDSVMQPIFKSQYLVKTAQVEVFRAESEKLAESYKSLGFELQIEGPYPASQFTRQKVIASGQPLQTVVEAG